MPPGSLLELCVAVVAWLSFGCSGWCCSEHAPGKNAPRRKLALLDVESLTPMPADWEEYGYYGDDGQFYYYGAEDDQLGYYAEDGQYYYYEQQTQDQHTPLSSATPASAKTTVPTPIEEPKKQKKKSRIDPRQVPRPIVYKSNNAETGAIERAVYYTNSGTLPPPAIEDFTAVDEGNCSPKFMRCSLYQIPNAASLVQESRLGISAVIQPLASLGVGEESIPLVPSMGEGGPLRCSRCLAYINPFDQFLDRGTVYQCALCDKVNNVPHDYQCNLDENGLRRDRLSRPELFKGSVDFDAPMYREATSFELAYTFVIDVSYTAVSSGLFDTSIRAIITALDHLGEVVPHAKIGIVAYDASVYFFTLSKDDPGIIVIGDVDDVFLPLPGSQVLTTVDSGRAQALLERFYGLFGDTRSEKRAMGAAIGAAAELMVDFVGKIIVTQSGLPNHGAGKLEDRDDVKLSGSADEKVLFGPQDSFYQVLSTRLAETQTSVDLFIAANSFVDVATVGIICRYTGGQLFLYSGFESQKDSYSLENDVLRTISRETVYESVMAVRCSAGLKAAEYYGNFFVRNEGELELAAVDSDKTFACRFEHNEKLKTGSKVCFQTALLYTTKQGECRIRVHTVSLPVVNSMGQVFKHADIDTFANVSARQVIKLVHDMRVADARKTLREATVDMLYTYRRKCATSNSSGQLILPEALKLMPLYSLGMLKNPILLDFVPSDERVAMFDFCNSIPLSASVPFCCPRLYALHTIPEEACVWDETYYMQFPPVEVVSSDFLSSDGIYLLDAGVRMYIWIGRHVDAASIFELFGVDKLRSEELHYLYVYPNDDPYSLASRTSCLIETLKLNRPMYCSLQIVQEDHADSLDYNNFQNHLIEDKIESIRGQSPLGHEADRMTYVEYLCFVHRQIQDKFL